MTSFDKMFQAKCFPEDDDDDDDDEKRWNNCERILKEECEKNNPAFNMAENVHWRLERAKVFDKERLRVRENTAGLLFDCFDFNQTSKYVVYST